VKTHKKRWEGKRRKRTDLNDKKEAFYNSPDWKKDVQRTLKRDKYQCQACGATKKDRKRLGAHHIYPLGDWMSEGKDSNDYPDDWLVTVCPRCHPPTDRQKGPMKYPKRPRKR
jgi:5-methylcytosine-specific restriction endonuclease McrA